MVPFIILISCACGSSALGSDNVVFNFLSVSVENTDNDVFGDWTLWTTGDTRKKLQGNGTVKKDITEIDDVFVMCELKMDDGLIIGPASLTICQGLQDKTVGEDVLNHSNFTLCPITVGYYEMVDYMLNAKFIPINYPRGKGTITMRYYKNDVSAIGGDILENPIVIVHIGLDLVFVDIV